MPINIAIIEDEPAIARNLEFTLKDIDQDIHVLNKMDSVATSVSWLKDHMEECNLLFMDIRLTDGLSFDIFKFIKPSVPIIFITAYDHYALEAFRNIALCVERHTPEIMKTVFVINGPFFFIFLIY